MRRIERLINLIAALLETSQPMTAEQIRTEIAGYDQANHDAFRRAFERDKEALRAMGIPLETRPSSNDPFVEQADAYIIPKELYYLPQLDLEPDELAALKLAADAVLGAGEEAGSGLMKISLDAATPSWSSARVMWGANVAAQQPFLGPLYSALLARRPVRFTYESAAGETSSRRVQPYGLVHRRGNWYLVGRDVDRDAVRAFRLSRIASRVETGDEPYDIPEGFDAAEHLAGEAYEIGSGQIENAVVRFSDAMRWWPEQNMPAAHLEEVEDGVQVPVPVANVDALVSWVIGFGPHATIVSPAAARSAVLQHVSVFSGMGS